MFLLLLLLLIPQRNFTHTADDLINHVMMSIEKAEKLSSGITAEILKIPGYSSPRVRHFLNNICSLPGTHYMEIGTWQGSTFVSALYNNHATMQSAIAIDNWSEFAGPKKEFHKNTQTFLRNNKFKFIEADCFTVPLRAIQNKINIYFFDGEHSCTSQKMAFTYFDPVLADLFIAIVDDYNWGQVQQGTQEAFKELGYTVLFEKYLPSPQNGSIDSWWNGIYVAVIKKKIT